MKRVLSFIPVFAAALLLLVETILPHHHHGEEICWAIETHETCACLETDQEENLSHHCTSGENSPEEHTCVLKRMYILQRHAELLPESFGHSLLTLFVNTSEALEVHRVLLATLSPEPTLLSLPLRAVEARGLRAPPVEG